jgi:hypothetical protein
MYRISMSDLSISATDQAATPTTRINAANRPARDRRYRISDLAIVVVFSITFGCAHHSETKAPPKLEELWVDQFAQPDGDGSKEAPLKELPSPLAKRALHLRTGIYKGPIDLPEGSTLEGHGEVVITNESDEPTLTATLSMIRHISIQGGAIGLQSKDVALDGVRFSGQTRTAIAAEGALRGRKLQFIASIEGVDGVVAKDAKVAIVETRFQGGFAHAVDVTGGELRLSGVIFEGAKSAVRATDTNSSLDTCDAMGGSAAAFFFAGGKVKAHGLDVQGYEFALQLARGVDAKFEDISLRGASQSCIAVDQSTLNLSRARMSRCGVGGAISATNSKLTASDIAIRDGHELGVMLRQGEASFIQLDVQGIAGGDGLQIREGSVSVRDSFFKDLEGSALFVSAGAKVTGTNIQVERAGKSAFFIERAASVELGDVLVRGGSGPAVLLPDAASAKFDSLSVSGGNEQPIYAECDAGAKVVVKRLESTIQPVASRCVSGK